MRKELRYLVVTSFCVVLQGCIGGEGIQGGVEHYDGCSVGSGAVSVGDQKIRLTGGDMVRVYGKPEKTSGSGDAEDWYYPAGQKWRGAVVYVILPIPLLVPTGHDYHVLHFRQGLCETEDFQIDADQVHDFQCGLLSDRHGSMALQCSRG